MRLTLHASAVTALVVAAVLGCAGCRRHASQKPDSADGKNDEQKDAKKGEKKSGSTGSKKKQNRIVIGVNDSGGAYPGVVANDGATPGANSRFSAAGLDVEIKLIRGVKERLAAFDSGEVDIMVLTLDYFANLVPVYRDKGESLQAFLLADWSRGNLGIVSTPKIKSLEALRDAKIATTRNTPTHYLFLNLLEKSNLPKADIDKLKSNIVFATKTPLAGDMFRRGEVDAVAISEPYLSQATVGGKGRLLVSTATASNLVGDVLFAREELLKSHEAELTKFARAWFEGVAQLDKDPTGSVQIIAKALQQPVDETRAVLSKIKPATFADNWELFGLDNKRAPYLKLFDDAGRFWANEGLVKAVPEASLTRWLKPLEALVEEHANERVAEHWRFNAGGPKGHAVPLLTRSVPIYFAPGGDTLDANARALLDELAETLSELGNAYVRVEVNTDNVGAREINVKLSKHRALAIIEYLTTQHGLPRARFSAVGNGPDKPVGENASEAGRALNRRTEFAIIPNE